MYGRIRSCAARMRLRSIDISTFLPGARTAKVLGARAEPDETSGQLSQNRKPFQQTNHKRQGLFVAGRSTSDDPPMNKNLHSLDQARRPLATRLHLSQVVHRDRSASQFFSEQVRRRDRIL